MSTQNWLLWWMLEYESAHHDNSFNIIDCFLCGLVHFTCCLVLTHFDSSRRYFRRLFWIWQCSLNFLLWFGIQVIWVDIIIIFFIISIKALSNQFEAVFERNAIRVWISYAQHPYLVMVKVLVEFLVIISYKNLYVLLLAAQILSQGGSRGEEKGVKTGERGICIHGRPKAQPNTHWQNSKTKSVIYGVMRLEIQ